MANELTNVKIWVQVCDHAPADTLVTDSAGHVERYCGHCATLMAAQRLLFPNGIAR